MARFSLNQFDPCPLSAAGVFDEVGASETKVLVLDIQSKYFFVDLEGKKYHEYYVPGTSDIQSGEPGDRRT